MHKLDPNYVYARVQRGDSVLAPGKEKNLRLYSGMMDYIDPQMWPKQEVVLSDYNMGEACTIKLPRSFKPDLVASALGYKEANMSKYRTRRRYFDIDALASKLNPQCPDFKTKFLSHKTKLPVLDGTKAIPKSMLKDTWDVPFSSRAPILDVGQITAGNFTVGPVGADYPVWGGVGGARGNYGNLTGDLTLTQIGAVVNVVVAQGVITFGGFTLTEQSNNPHYGDPTAGWACTFPNNIDGFDTQFEGPGNHIMRNLFPSYVNAQGAVNVSLHTINTIVAAFTGHYYNSLYDMNANRGGCVSLLDNTPIIYFFNEVYYNASNAANGYGWGTFPANANTIIANCGAWNNDENFRINNQAITLRNNVALEHAGGGDFVTIGAATGRYNVSSDATAADVNWGAALGNIINEVAANCVLGVNPAIANFMDILPGGTLDGAGEANNAALGRTLCLRNRAVPGPNGTSIGPAEVAATPTPPTPGGRQGGASPHRQQYWRRMMANKLSP